jgi:hypothetical protein
MPGGADMSVIAQDLESKHSATASVNDFKTGPETESARRKAIVRWVAVSLVLVLLNLAVVEFGTRFIVFLGKPAASQNPQFDSKKLVADTIYAGQDNIILCGDSLMKQGIYPELLSSKLHKWNDYIRVVNLATNAGTQKDAIAFLNYVVKNRGIKPRLVMFDYEIANTGYTVEESNFEWGQKTSYLFNGALSRPHTLAQFVDILPKDMSLLIRHRGELKHFLVDFLSSLPNIRQYTRKSFFELSDVNDHETSWAGMSPDSRITSEKDRAQQEWRIHSSYKHSPKGGKFAYNHDAYSLIIKYCQQNQIPLVLVWLPHESSVYQEFWYNSQYDSNFFRKEFESYGQEPFVYPVFLNKLPEKCEYFADYRHLNTYGCVKATELMADELLSRQPIKNILFDFRKVMEKTK